MCKSKNNRDNYQPYNAEEASDNYLRMKVKDPSRWSTLDYDMYGNYYSPYSAFSPYGGAMPFMPYAGIGYGGYYNPFGWNSYLGYGGMYFGNYYNPYSYFGGFNPYYYGGYPVVIVKPGSGSTNPYVNGPRVFNLNGYGNSSYLPPSGRNGNINKNNSANLSRNAPVRVFGNNSNNNNSNSSGNYLRGSGSNSGRSFSPSTATIIIRRQGLLSQETALHPQVIRETRLWRWRWRRLCTGKKFSGQEIIHPVIYNDIVLY